MAVAAFDDFRNKHATLIRSLHQRSGAATWSLQEDDLAHVLHKSVAARFADVDTPTAAAVEQYLESLHVEDLALATACEHGDQDAWHHLLENFRPAIVGAARAVAKDDSHAEDLANEIYADLYGLEQRDGRRRSLFSYFHGRSSLRTWLRSVVARSYVNAHRASKRGETLRDRLVGEVATETAAFEPPDPRRAKHAELLGRALASALGKLESRDRLRLASYYVQNLTLDEVGRMLGEHESTVSRKLERTRKLLRKEIEQRLGSEGGLSETEIRDCYEAALESGAFDLGKIEQVGAPPTFQE